MKDCSEYSRKYYSFIRKLRLITMVIPDKLQALVCWKYSLIISPDRCFDQRMIDALPEGLLDKVEASTNDASKNNPYCKNYSTMEFIHNFHSHVSVSGLDFIKMSTKGQSWLDKNVIGTGVSDLKKSVKEIEGGVLFLTFHNHYKFLCMAIMGMYGIRLSTLAMDYRISEVYKCRKPGRYIEDIFLNSERYFNGGRYILVDGNNNLATIRAVGRGLKKNKLLASLNDIVSDQAGKRNCRVGFFDKELICPTGTVDMALQKKSDIYVGWAYWDRQAKKYKFEARKLDVSKGTTGVISQYIATLEEIVRNDPSIWEGWKLLSSWH